MKRTIFILLVNIIWLGSNDFILAQAYKPLAVDGTHWIVSRDNDETIWPIDDLWEYYCNGDTTLEGIEYKKIYRRDLEVEQTPPFTGISPYSIFGFIRDDTTAKKVYSIDWYSNFDHCPDGVEYLLFDFSYQLGDSVDLCIYPIEYEGVITYIQYVYYNNQWVKEFQMFFGSMLEGIGSSYGLFEEMNEGEFTRTYLVYHCSETPCGYLVSTQDFEIPDNFDISPNPATDMISFSFNQTERWQKIMVYNSHGTLIGEYDLPAGSENYTINTSNLSPSLYFCSLSNNTHRSPLRKIVVIK